MPHGGNLDLSHIFLLTSKVYSFVLRHLQNYPAPIGLNLSWTFGSLSMLALILQIATGLCLSMHYIPGIDVAFDSVEHIVRDVRGGHFLRYAHSNGASFYFICVYSHILRSLYYKSFIENKSPWNIGILIFAASMAAAFLGYVLPWGQMSFWGATVITNLFSVIPFIGTEIVHFLWGGFGVGGPTLNRFYTLHFIIPLIILALVMVHILALHENGSTTPYRGNWGDDTISFFTYYIIKDLYLIGYFLAIFLLFLIYAPNYLNHPDNYNKADPMKTPPHIVPEWYFLPFYAILRAIPNKTLGVVAMGASIAFLVLLPPMGALSKLNMTYSANDKIVFWTFVLTSAVLGFLGSMPIETPFVQMSWMFCQLYFLLGLAIGGASWLFGNRYAGSKNEVYKSQILNHKNRQIGQVFIYLWLFHNSVMLMKQTSGRGAGYWRRGRFYRINEDSWKQKNSNAGGGVNTPPFKKKSPRNNSGDSLNSFNNFNTNSFNPQNQTTHQPRGWAGGFRNKKQAHKKINQGGYWSNLQQQDVVEVQIFYEAQFQQTIEPTTQVIDIYVDDNVETFRSGHLDDWGGGVVNTSMGNIKLIPYIEQPVVPIGRTGESKILRFIAKTTSYIVENYKSILSILSLLIVFVYRAYTYITSDSFNQILNSGLKLRKAFGGCFWNMWFFFDENVRALFEVTLILKSICLTIYIKCQTVFVGAGWCWDDSFANTFPEFFDYVPITASRYEYGLEKLIFLRIERFETYLLSMDITYKIESVLEYLVMYYGQIQHVSTYEKFLFFLILTLISLILGCVVFLLTNFTFTILLPTAILTVPLLFLIYMFQVYDFTESWLLFRIDESFKNTNLYGSGNFFITNSALAGFERYGSLQLPWSVHENSFGWGPKFNKQTQADKIRERDRVIKDANFVNSTVPNLNSDPISSGTFWNRTIKGWQRTAYIWESLKRAVYYSENFLSAERDKYLRVGHKFFDGGGKLTSLLSYGCGNLTNNAVPGINFPDGGEGKRPDLNFIGQNDFLLPAKNSIVSQTSTVGSTESRRRKHALMDAPKSPKLNFLPTGGGASSHLFEKNIQDEKSFELNVKAMLESAAVDLWEYSDARSVDLLPLTDVHKQPTNPPTQLADYLSIGESLGGIEEMGVLVPNSIDTYDDLFYTNLQTKFRRSDWYSVRTGGRGKVRTNFKSSGSAFVEGFASGNSLHKSLTYAKDVAGLYLGKYRYGSGLTHLPHINSKEDLQNNINRSFTLSYKGGSSDVATILNLSGLCLSPKSSIVLEIERLCKTLQVSPTSENIINLLRLAVLETLVSLQTNHRYRTDDATLSVMYTWFGKLGVMSCWSNFYRRRLKLVLLSSILLEPYEKINEVGRSVSQLDESLVRPYKYLYNNDYVETLSKILTFTEKRQVKQNRFFTKEFFRLHPARSARTSKGAYGRSVFSPKMKKSTTPLAIKFNIAPNLQFIHYINKKHPLDYAISYSETISLQRVNYILSVLFWNIASLGSSFFGGFFFPVRGLFEKAPTEVHNWGLLFRGSRVSFHRDTERWFGTEKYFQTLNDFVYFSTTGGGQFNTLTRHINQVRLPANLRVKKLEKLSILLLPNPTITSQQLQSRGLPPANNLDYFRYSNNITKFRKYWSGAVPKNKQPTGGFTKEMARVGLSETPHNKTHPIVYGFFFYPKYIHEFKNSAMPGIWKNTKELKKHLRSALLCPIVGPVREMWKSAILPEKISRRSTPIKQEMSIDLLRRKKYLNRRIWRAIKKKKRVGRLNFNLRGYFSMFENRSRRISLFMAYFIKKSGGTGFKYITDVGPGGDILKFKRMYINLISNWDKAGRKKPSGNRFQPYFGRYLVGVGLVYWPWFNRFGGVVSSNRIDSTFFKTIQSASVTYSDIFKKILFLDQVESEKTGLLLENIGRGVNQQITFENFPNKTGVTSYSKDSTELIPLAPSSVTFRYLLNDVWYRSGNILVSEDAPGRRRRRNKKGGFGDYRKDIVRTRRSRRKKSARIRVAIKTGDYDVNPRMKMLGKYELKHYRVKKKIRGALSGIYALSEADTNARDWSESWRLAQDRHGQTLLYQTNSLPAVLNLFKIKNITSMFNFLTWGNLNQTKTSTWGLLTRCRISLGGWVSWARSKYPNSVWSHMQHYVANKLGGYFFQPLQLEKRTVSWLSTGNLSEYIPSPVNLQIDRLDTQTYDYYSEAKDRYQTDFKLVNLFSTNHVDFLDPLREIINEDVTDSPVLLTDTRSLVPYLQTKTQGKLTSKTFLEYGQSSRVGIENSTGVSVEWDWKTYFARRERSSSVTFSNLAADSLKSISPVGGDGKNLKLSQDGGRGGADRSSHYLFRFLTSEGNRLAQRPNELQYYEKSVGEKYETTLDNFLSLDWILAGYYKEVLSSAGRLCEYRPDFSFLKPTIRAALKSFPRLVMSTSWVFMFGTDDLFSISSEFQFPDEEWSVVPTVLFSNPPVYGLEIPPSYIKSEDLILAILEFYGEDLSNENTTPLAVSSVEERKGFVSGGGVWGGRIKKWLRECEFRLSGMRPLLPFWDFDPMLPHYTQRLKWYFWRSWVFSIGSWEDLQIPEFPILFSVAYRFSLVCHFCIFYANDFLYDFEPPSLKHKLLRDEGWVEIWAKFSSQTHIGYTGRIFSERNAFTWNEKYRDGYRLLILKFADYVSESGRIDDNHPSVDLGGYGSTLGETPFITILYYCIELLAENQPKDLRFLYDLPLVDIYSYHAKLTDPNTIYFILSDFWDFTYRWTLGTFRYHVKEYFKFYWRKYTPFFENLREMLATELDDNELDIETMTEEYEPSDIAEDDPDIVNFEGIPMGDLTSGSPSLLIRLVDYASDSFQVLELENIFHYLAGLDSVDGAGLIEREFDINLIVRSLWSVDVLFYAPYFGGFAIVNFSALLDFITIIFLDQRGFFSSAIYYWLDESRYVSLKLPSAYWTVKIFDTVDSLIRVFDYFYFSVGDFSDGFFLYLNFVFNVYGVWMVLVTFILLLLFGKLNLAAERAFRTSSRSQFSALQTALLGYNLFLFKNLYYALSNLVILLRMVSMLLLLSAVGLLLIDGFRIAGISRLYIVDRGDLKYLNGLFFSVERDPFVEKHVPIDEVWDEFKYDSMVDEDYDKYHFVRKRAELFGGPVWESGAMVDASGFAKNFDWGSEDGPGFKEKDAGQQEHNRFIDENSYIPGFVERTENEHDYIYDFEAHDNVDRDGIGALSYEDDDLFDDEEGSDEEEEMNPKTAHERQEIIKHEGIPLIFRGSKVGLVDRTTDTGNRFNFTGQVLANNKLYNLVARKQGEMQTDPVEDSSLLEEPDLGDIELELSDRIFWNSAFGDPITQYNRNSLEPNVDWPVPFNYNARDKEEIFKEEAHRFKKLGGRVGFYKKRYYNPKFYTKSNYFRGFMRSAAGYFKPPKKKKSKKIKKGKLFKLGWDTLTFAAKENLSFFEHPLVKTTTSGLHSGGFSQTSRYPTSKGSVGGLNRSYIDFSGQEASAPEERYGEISGPFKPRSFLKIKAIRQKLKYGPVSPIRSWRFLDLSAENILKATPVSEFTESEKFTSAKIFYIPKSPLRKETILLNRRAYRQTRDKYLSIFYKYDLRRQTMKDRRIHKFADIGSNSFEKRSFVRSKKSWSTTTSRPTDNRLKKNMKKTKYITRKRSPIQLLSLGYTPTTKHRRSYIETDRTSRHEYEQIVGVRGRALDGIYKKYRPKGRKKRLWGRDIPGSLLYANDFILFSFLDRHNRNTPWRAKRRESRKAFNLTTRYWGESDFQNIKPKTHHPYLQTFSTIKIHPRDLQRVEYKVYKNELSYFLDEVRSKKREWKLEDRSRIFKKDNASKNFKADSYFMRLGAGFEKMSNGPAVDNSVRRKKIIITENIPKSVGGSFYRLGRKNSSQKQLAVVLQKNLKVKFLGESLQKQKLKGLPTDPELALTKKIISSVKQNKIKKLRVLNPTDRWFKSRSKLKLKYKTTDPLKMYLKNYKKIKKSKSTKNTIKIKMTDSGGMLKDSSSGVVGSRLGTRRGRKIVWDDNLFRVEPRGHISHSKIKFADWKFIFRVDKKTIFEKKNTWQNNTVVPTDQMKKLPKWLKRDVGGVEQEKIRSVDISTEKAPVVSSKLTDGSLSTAGDVGPSSTYKSKTINWQSISHRGVKKTSGSRLVETKDGGSDAAALTKRIGRRTLGDIEQGGGGEVGWKSGRKVGQKWITSTQVRRGVMGLNSSVEKIEKKKLKTLTSTPPDVSPSELLEVEAQLTSRETGVMGGLKKNRKNFIKKKIRKHSKSMPGLSHTGKSILFTHVKTTPSPYKHSKFYNRDRLPEWANESISRDSFLAKKELRDLLGGLDPIRPKVRSWGYSLNPKRKELEVIFSKKNETRVEKFFRRLLQPKLKWGAGGLSEYKTSHEETSETNTVEAFQHKTPPPSNIARWRMFGLPPSWPDKRPHIINAATKGPFIFLTNSKAPYVPNANKASFLTSSRQNDSINTSKIYTALRQKIDWGLEKEQNAHWEKSPTLGDPSYRIHPSREGFYSTYKNTQKLGYELLPTRKSRRVKIPAQNLFDKLAMYGNLKFKNHASAERLMRSIRSDMDRGLITREGLRSALQAYDDLQTVTKSNKPDIKTNEDWIKNHLYFEDKVKVRRSEKGLRSPKKFPRGRSRGFGFRGDQNIFLSDLGRSLEKKINMGEFLNFTKLDIEPIGGAGYLYEHKKIGNLILREHPSTLKNHLGVVDTPYQKQNLRYFGETPPNRREGATGQVILQNVPYLPTTGFGGSLTANRFFFETPIASSPVSKKNILLGKSPTQSRHSLLRHYKKSLIQAESTKSTIEDELWSKIKITLLGLNSYPRFQDGGAREVGQEKSEYFIENAKKNFEKIRNKQLRTLMHSASVRQFRVGILKSPNQFKYLQGELNLPSVRQGGWNTKKPWAAPLDTSRAWFGNKLLTKNPGKRYVYNKPVDVLSQIELNYETPWKSRPMTYNWELATEVPTTNPYAHKLQYSHEVALKKIPEYADYLKFKRDFDSERMGGFFFSTISNGADWKVSYLDKSGLSRPDLKYGGLTQIIRTEKEKYISNSGKNKLVSKSIQTTNEKKNITEQEFDFMVKKFSLKNKRGGYDSEANGSKKDNSIGVGLGFKKFKKSSADVLGLGTGRKIHKAKLSGKSGTAVVFDSNLLGSPHEKWRSKKEEKVRSGDTNLTSQKSLQNFQEDVGQPDKNKKSESDQDGSNLEVLDDDSPTPGKPQNKNSLVNTVKDIRKTPPRKDRSNDHFPFPDLSSNITKTADGERISQDKDKSDRTPNPPELHPLTKKRKGGVNSDKKSSDRGGVGQDIDWGADHVNSYRNYFLIDGPEKEQFYRDKLQERYYRRLSLVTSTPIWNANYQNSIFLAPDYAKRRFIQGDHKSMNFMRGKEITSHFRRFKPPSNVKYTNPYDEFYRSQSIKRLLKKRTTSYVGKNNWQLKRILRLKDLEKRRKKKPRMYYHFKLPLYKVGSTGSSAPENFVSSLSFNSNLFDKTRSIGILPSELSNRKLGNRTLRYSFLNKNRVRIADVSSVLEKYRNATNRDHINLKITKNPGKGGRRRFSTKEGHLLRKKFRASKRWRRRKYITYYPRLNKQIFGEFRSRNWAPKRVGGRWNQKMRKKPTYMFNHFKTNKTLFKKSILWGEGYIPYKSGATIRRSEFSLRSIPPRERSMSFLYGRNSSWKDVYEWEATGSGGHSNSMVKKLRSSLYATSIKYPPKLWEKGSGMYKKKFAKVYSKTLNYAALRSGGMYKKYTNHKKFESRKKFLPRLMFYGNLPNHRHSGLYPTPRLASYPWRGILSEQNFDPFYDANTRTGNYWVTEKFHFDPRNDNGISHYSNPSEDINADGDDLWSLPGLSFYVIKEDYDPEIGESVMQRLNRRFELRDTYKKKDKFSFAPRVRPQNFLSEHTEWDETWLQPPNGSKFFSWNNIPFNYVDPSNSEYHQPRGLHSFKIDDDGTFAENASYYALSDYLTGSRIRSDDMGYARTPLRKPDTQFISLTDDTITNDERAGSLPTVEYEKFKDRDLNFRDLWWRSVEGGYLRTEAQREFSYSMVKDRNENYRDFLLSYDYRLFGKSWMQPQNVTNPIVATAFEQDTAINEWFGKRDDDISHNTGISNNYDNYFFGDFVDLFPHFPYAHFEGNFLFWATQLRDILQYSSTFAWYYFTSLFGVVLEMYRYIPVILNNGVESRLQTLLALVSFLKIYYLTFFAQSISFWPVGVLHSLIESTIVYYFTFYNYIWNFSNVEKNNDRSTTDSGPVFKFIEKLLTQPAPKMGKLYTFDFYFILFVLIYVLFALVL